MVTLKNVLAQRGYAYNTVFADKAEDISFNTVGDLCFSLGYILKNVKRFDAEIPADRDAILRRIMPNYRISLGNTSGGNDMKWAPQYRIYFKDISQMPPELEGRLQDDTQMRITGSLFVEACMYIGFNPGKIQDDTSIKEVIREVFSEDEYGKFLEGYET